MAMAVLCSMTCTKSQLYSALLKAEGCMLLVTAAITKQVFTQLGSTVSLQLNVSCFLQLLPLTYRIWKTFHQPLFRFNGMFKLRVLNTFHEYVNSNLPGEYSPDKDCLGWP